MAGTIIPRRAFLALSGGTVAATTGLARAAAAIPLTAGAPAAAGPFLHGVASGDPLPERVVLWTRLTPAPGAVPGSGAGPDTEVQWQVALDPAMTQLVAAGHVMASSSSDHTVHVDAGGLSPDTTYFFRFSALGATSPVGRTRTAPAPEDPADRLRFGVVSCSNWTGGFFSPYRFLAGRDDLDAVIELGDYLYEYGNGADRYGPESLRGIRDHVPAHEMVTLADYRARHGQYKTDPDLQALHASVPWIATIDDHEVADNSWAEGAENHQPGEGSFAARRAAALQAWFEWMPVRRPDPGSSRVFRRFRFGTLADLTMLDLRTYRSKQASSPLDPAVGDAARRIMSPEELDWFTNGLDSSGAVWKLVGNSVMIAPLLFGGLAMLPPALEPARNLVEQAIGGVTGSLPVDGVPFNTDQWDGYRADQTRVLDHIAEHGIDGVVFLTGDIHSSWAMELPHRGKASVAVEYVTPSVTSDSIGDTITAIAAKAPAVGEAMAPAVVAAAEGAFRTANPHIRMLDASRHGAMILELTPQHTQADWYYSASRTDPNAPVSFGSAWRTARESNTLQAASPLAPVERRPSPAPAATPAPAAPPASLPAGGSRRDAGAGSTGARLAYTGSDDRRPLVGGALGLAAALGAAALARRGSVNHRRPGSGEEAAEAGGVGSSSGEGSVP